MAFTRVQSRVPAIIGPIEVHLADANGDNAQRSVRGSVRILDQNGELLKEWTGDLRSVNALTAQQLSQLAAIQDSLRTKAAAEFLP